MGIFTDVYTPLQSTISGQTHRSTRKLANNTYGTIHSDRSITVRFHATDIVSADYDRATYNTGGWWTVTTKDRINRYLPHGWRLWSEKNVWRVGRYLSGDYVDISRFYDGITFVDDAAGHAKVENPQPVEDPHKAMRKAIDAYTKLYTEDELTRLRENTSIGDCMYCQIEVQNPGTLINSDHLLSHVDEGYTMLSLAFNALRFVGYRDPGLILSVDRGKMVRRAVKKYLTARLVSSGVGALANAS